MMLNSFYLSPSRDKLQKIEQKNAEMIPRSTLYTPKIDSVKKAGVAVKMQQSKRSTFEAKPSACISSLKVHMVKPSQASPKLLNIMREVQSLDRELLAKKSHSTKSCLTSRGKQRPQQNSGNIENLRGV